MMAAGREASAQWSGDPMDQIAQIQREQAAAMDRINAENQQLEQMQLQHQRQMIHDRRQMTGDWETPDQIVYQQMWNEYYQQNPGAYQAHLAEQQMLAQGYQQIHQQRMNDIAFHGQARSAAIADAANYCNDLSMQGFQSRMDSMDRIQHDNINGIYERSDWINPQTGAVTSLSFHPNQIQQVGNDTWYTDNHGDQYLVNPGNQGYGDW
jgi:hypothetical protein